MTRLRLRHRVLTIWAMVLISTVSSTVLAQSLDKDQLRMLNRHVEEFETYPLMLVPVAMSFQLLPGVRLAHP